MLDKLNVSSIGYTGNELLPADNDRGYLFIVPTSAPLTIEINGGGGLIPIPIGGYYEPRVVPTGTLDIVCAGEWTIVTDS